MRLNPNFNILMAGAFRHDFFTTEGRLLQLGMQHDCIDHAHFVGFLCGVRRAKEEDLTGALLAHLTCEVSRPKPSKLATSASVCLNTACSLLAMVMSHTTCKLSSTDGPSGHHGDDHLVHETDLTLDVEDVESVDAILALVSRVGTTVPAAATPNRRPWAKGLRQ